MVSLRFLLCWNGFDRGAEVDFPHPGLAEELVRLKIAELRNTTAPKAGSASDPAAAKMTTRTRTTTRSRKKRG